MESMPMNWEALDALVIDFAKSENLIEDSAVSSPSSPSSSPSSSSYHSRVLIRQVRRLLEVDDIDVGPDLLRAHAPSDLDDHRLLFRLQKQDGEWRTVIALLHSLYIHKSTTRWKWSCNYRTEQHQQKEMGEREIGANGGGEATEATANSIAGATRTKSAATSLVPPKRKLVKKMMWDSIVQASVSAACYTSIENKKKIFPA